MCQSVSNEVWLAWFIFQAKILSCFGECQWGWQKYIFPSPPLFKDKGLKDIGHRMSIGNVILVVSGVTVRCLIRYDTLLRNVSDIIKKYDSYFIRNVTFITNCNNFITKCDSYYKMRRLLQIVTVQWASQSYLQILSVLLNKFP